MARWDRLGTVVWLILTVGMAAILTRLVVGYRGAIEGLRAGMADAMAQVTSVMNSKPSTAGTACQPLG